MWARLAAYISVRRSRGICGVAAMNLAPLTLLQPRSYTHDACVLYLYFFSGGRSRVSRLLYYGDSRERLAILAMQLRRLANKGADVSRTHELRVVFMLRGSEYIGQTKCIAARDPIRNC